MPDAQQVHNKYLLNESMWWAKEFLKYAVGFSGLLDQVYEWDKKYFEYLLSASQSQVKFSFWNVTWICVIVLLTPITL